MNKMYVILFESNIEKKNHFMTILLLDPTYFKINS